MGDEYFQSIAHVSLYVDIKKEKADATWVNMGPADEALRKLATQTSVRTLQIGGEQVTDENLSYVGQMTGLEELSISWGYHLTDKGFLQLSGLKRLRILEVDHSKMTDASLEAIGKSDEPRRAADRRCGLFRPGSCAAQAAHSLEISVPRRGEPPVSDAGLDLLKSMKELEHLDLSGWHVNDEGIAKLRELKNLKTVHIGLSDDQGDRRKRLQGLLPGVIQSIDIAKGDQTGTLVGAGLRGCNDFDHEGTTLEFRVLIDRRHPADADRSSNPASGLGLLIFRDLGRTRPRESVYNQGGRVVPVAFGVAE